MHSLQMTYWYTAQHGCTKKSGNFVDVKLPNRLACPTEVQGSAGPRKGQVGNASYSDAGTHQHDLKPAYFTLLKRMSSLESA